MEYASLRKVAIVISDSLDLTVNIKMVRIDYFLNIYLLNVKI